jgi:hypothetical protein
MSFPNCHAVRHFRPTALIGNHILPYFNKKIKSLRSQDFAHDMATLTTDWRGFACKAGHLLSGTAGRT